MSDPTPPRYLKPMNKIMMGLQKLGIQTGPAMVLTVPGRKSGQPRSTPMSPFEFQGQLYTVAGYPARRLGAQRPGRRCRDALARPKVASGQDRRTQPGRSASGAAGVPGQGSGRRRVRQALGPGAGRNPGRVRGARRPVPGVPVRPRRLGHRLGRGTLHHNITGAGPHVHDEGLVTVGGPVGRLQGVAHST